MDEPSDPIAACVYHAAELAAQHVKVVMGGDGGDELFAGFDRYKGVGYIDRYTMIPALLRSKLIGPVLNALPDSYTYKSITQKLRWMHQIAELSSLGERYAEATLFFRFNQEDKKLLFSDSLWRQVGGINSANVIVEQFEHANAEDPLDRMLYADIMTRLPEHSLMLTDRMTMAHSLEARSPFLDHTLVEYMASYPSNMKIRNGELKYALRKLAVEFLPDQIVNRDKQGFMFPIAYWFKNDLYNFLKRFMMDSIFVKEGIFKRERVMHLIDEHRSNKMDHHVRLWMLLNLQIWFMLYIDQCTVEEVEERMLTYL
jgi:asparagine synthase (glutamine-hydrolysing)